MNDKITSAVADAYRKMYVKEDFPNKNEEDDDKKKADAEAAQKPADEKTPADSGKPSEDPEKKNAENVLVIHDNPEVVSDYEKQWEKLWDESE